MELASPIGKVSSLVNSKQGAQYIYAKNPKIAACKYTKYTFLICNIKMKIIIFIKMEDTIKINVVLYPKYLLVTYPINILPIAQVIFIILPIYPI